MVLWEQLDGNKMRLTSSKVASVDLVVLGSQSPRSQLPTCTCGGRGSEYGHSPLWAAASPVYRSA